MKKIIRVSVLFLVLLLLTGCGNQPASNRKYKATANKKLLFPTNITELSATNDTEPTHISTTPTETTAPTTIPTTTQPTTPETPVTPTTPASSAGYGAVYEDICDYLRSPDWDKSYKYVTTGIMEAAGSGGSFKDRAGYINYALEDINSDGTREMVVVDSMGNTRILAIYALQGGQPVLINEGWARSRLYRLSDGSLYKEGSNGAAYSIFEAGGQRWFTYPTEDYSEMRYYYAADGSYDPATAQQITEEEYNAKQTELAQMIIAFSVCNFT